MTNIFHQQPEFVTNDSFFYTAEGSYIRYSKYIDPLDLKDKSILDVGSYYAQCGAYALSNGAKEYVGIEIIDASAFLSKEALQKYYPNDNWEILHMSFEDFMKTNTKKFDIIFLGRVLFFLSTRDIESLTYLANIGDVIVIESVPPINRSFLELRSLLEENDILNQLPKEKILEINRYFEYEQSYVEYIEGTNRDCLSVLHSLGFLKKLFDRLGFECDLEPYEYMKENFPEEYGYGFMGKDEKLVKKYIVRFDKKKNATPKPLSHLEFERIRGTTTL